MVVVQEGAQILFQGLVPIHIKNNQTSKRQWTITTVSTSQQTLYISLTDELDLNFLFNFAIDEDDFDELKKNQNLLVDFRSFPHKFVELLTACCNAMPKGTFQSPPSNSFLTTVFLDSNTSTGLLPQHS